jgi:hypothetical protein
MSPDKIRLDLLDTIIHRIIKVNENNSEMGLAKGKIGISILLFNYARYRNKPEIMEQANRLIDNIVQKIKLNSIKGFDNELSDIAWGLDCLRKQEFILISKEVTDGIDSTLFIREKKALSLYGLGVKYPAVLYAWSKSISCKSDEKGIWLQHIESYINQIHNNVIQKYTNYELPFIPCWMLIRFFYICQTLREHGYFSLKIDALYDELSEIVKISFNEEKLISDKYLLALMLSEIPMFEKCITFSKVQQSITLADVRNLYLTRFLLNYNISMPTTVNHYLKYIIENHQQIYELLNKLNQNNAGLGKYFGGLAWAILQWCIEKDIS